MPICNQTGVHQTWHTRIGVYTPPWLAGAAVAVGTMVPFTAFSQAIAGIVRTTEGTKNIPYIIVCDNDIDVTNPVVLFSRNGNQVPSRPRHLARSRMSLVPAMLRI